MNTILATIFYLANLLGLAPVTSAPVAGELTLSSLPQSEVGSGARPAVAAQASINQTLCPENIVGNGTRPY